MFVSHQGYFPHFSQSISLDLKTVFYWHFPLIRRSLWVCLIFDFVFCERLDHGGKETIALREAD